MKFLVDMPVTPRAVAHLQAKGHDAVHASQVGLADQADTAVLERAKAEGRVIVTADLDYPRLLAVQRSDGPGVILFRGGSFSDQEMLALLDRVLAQAADLGIERSITVVDQHRIRKHSLPIRDSD